MHKPVQAHIFGDIVTINGSVNERNNLSEFLKRENALQHWKRLEFAEISFLNAFSRIIFCCRNFEILFCFFVVILVTTNKLAA